MGIVLRLVQFGIVGLSGMVTDFSITWLFREKLKINQYWANSVGFLIAMAQNFYLNLSWTFDDRKIDKAYTHFFSYFMIGLIGLMIHTFILKLLNRNVASLFYLNKLIATLCVFIWNFTLNNFITFAN